MVFNKNAQHGAWRSEEASFKLPLIAMTSKIYLKGPIDSKIGSCISN